MSRPKLDQFSQEQFSARFEKALENNPNAPPKFHGERVWLSEQMAKKGQPVSPESIRKWLTGRNMPTHTRLRVLADILGVDPDWLLYGSASTNASRARVDRDQAINATTNLVAGMIEMDGAQVFYPAETKKHSNVHLNAVIGRTSYPLHISPGVEEGDEISFRVPAKLTEVVTIGVVRKEGEFGYEVFEIPESEILKSTEIAGGYRIVRTKRDKLKPIESFSERF